MSEAIEAQRPVGTVDREVQPAAALAEYLRLAERAGISSPAIIIERFRRFLADHDLPTFRKPAVVAYMDRLARAENPSGLGWHWRPLRAQDARVPLAFGVNARPAGDDQLGMRQHRDAMQALGYAAAPDIRNLMTGDELRQQHAAMHAAQNYNPGHPPRPIRLLPASDFYLGELRTPVYERAVPLHALAKAALINEAFGDRVCLFVSDYATPSTLFIEKPDPFLLAVIPNEKVGLGVGRFVIDVWDEPGFGLLDRL